MNKRQRKKRKKQVYLEGLERGNRYLADLVSRKIEETNKLRAGLSQIIELYHSYLAVICEAFGGNIEISKSRAAALREEYELEAKDDGDMLQLKVRKREQE